MCLIIFKPANVEVPDELWPSALKANDDGCGILWSDGNKLHAEKDTDTREVFRLIEDHTDKDVIIHLRFATHGDVILPNTHPFLITDELGFVHNGMLRTVKQTHPQYSDTWHMNEILKCYLSGNPELVFTPTFDEFLASYAGTDGGNKFAFMNAQGQVKLTLEDQWLEWQGVKLSNTYAYDAHRLGIKEKSYGFQWYDQDEDLVTLNDLADLTLDDLECLCYEDPHYVAALIHDYFNVIEWVS